MKFNVWIIVVLILCGVSVMSCAHSSLDLERLSDADIVRVKTVLAKLEPFITARKAQKTLATLTFDELYAPLSSEEKKFLKQFQTLSARTLNVQIPFRGIATGKEELITITGQVITIKGERKAIDPQYLPPRVYAAYMAMMDAMQKDIGKRMYIESGYRSSAYQVYLFVYYLQNHEYSIRETVKFNALAGYSEHGSVEHQAIDFINEEGINGEEDIPAFERLPEYQWLRANAHRFNFELSYPKDAQVGITYEPWHWRYVGSSKSS